MYFNKFLKAATKRLLKPVKVIEKVEIEVEKIVDKIIEKPIEVEKIVEKIIEKPIEHENSFSKSRSTERNNQKRRYICSSSNR